MPDIQLPRRDLSLAPLFGSRTGRGLSDELIKMVSGLYQRAA